MDRVVGVGERPSRDLGGSYVGYETVSGNKSNSQAGNNFRQRPDMRGNCTEGFRLQPGVRIIAGSRGKIA